MAFTCKVELNKEKGITLTVENTTGQITQTVEMDGTQIVIKVKGATDTSTITQKADSIEIKCKTMTLDAETLLVKSSKDSVYQSAQKLTMKSTQDMEIASSAKNTIKAATDILVQGVNATFKGDTSAKVQSAEVTVAADAKATLKGSPVEVSSALNLDVKGTAVKVAASGTLDLEGQVSTLKGQMTNVQGSLVKLG